MSEDQNLTPRLAFLDEGFHLGGAIRASRDERHER